MAELFLARVMRFLILLLVIVWSVALLRRAIAWMLRGLVNAPNQGANPTHDSQVQDVTASRRLVRDPVCGVHVAEARAIPLRDGGEVVHFCSAACRDKYTAAGKKFAANG